MRPTSSEHPLAPVSCHPGLIFSESLLLNSLLGHLCQEVEMLPGSRSQGIGNKNLLLLLEAMSRYSERKCMTTSLDLSSLAPTLTWRVPLDKAFVLCVWNLLSLIKLLDGLCGLNSWKVACLKYPDQLKIGTPIIINLNLPKGKQWCWVEIDKKTIHF